MGDGQHPSRDENHLIGEDATFVEETLSKPIEGDDSVQLKFEGVENCEHRVTRAANFEMPSIAV